MSDALLSVAGLNSHYGRAHILFDVGFEVSRGEAVALLGRNGAGKSTTLKSLLGLVRPTSGEISYAGRRIEREPTYKVSRLGLGYVPEDRRIFTDLTVEENLEVGKRQPREGVTHWTVERIFNLFPNLGSMRDRLGGRMSGGEQQMLAIARTLMGNPTLMLLDEPSEGLAPAILEQLAKTILELKSNGLTLIISEQNLYFASHVADKALIVEKGRIRYSGGMKALAADQAVQKEYLTA
jgi:branched-chain amino acid transport system ATP-binding protein